MFIRFHSPVFFDGDETPSGADGSLGSPSPTEVAPDDVAAARAAFLAAPPEVLSTDEPAAPAPDAAAVTEAERQAAIDELTTPPAAPAGTPPAAPTAGTHDPYAEFGGVEAVRQAAQVQAALRTEQGVRAMAGQALVALGYSPAQIAAALEGGPPVAGAAPEPAAPATPNDLLASLATLEDDDTVTGAQLKALVQGLAAQAQVTAQEQAAAQVAPLQSQWEQQQQHAVQAVADATYTELLGPTPTDPEALQRFSSQANRIQQIAESIVTPGETDPGRIRLALVTAHAQFINEQEAVFTAYLHAKKATAAALPANIGGGQPPGGEPIKEPQNMAEARAQARASGMFK